MPTGTDLVITDVSGYQYHVSVCDFLKVLLLSVVRYYRGAPSLHHLTALFPLRSFQGRVADRGAADGPLTLYTARELVGGGQVEVWGGQLGS